MQSQVDQLSELSTADEVTELLNVRGFCDVLDRELDRAKRNGGTGVLMLVGIDRLEVTNEHQDTDYIARISDSEFAVLLTHTSWPRGERRAKALERRLRDANISSGDRTIAIGAHVGVEFYRSGDEVDALLEHVATRLQSHRDGELELNIRTA